MSLRDLPLGRPPQRVAPKNRPAGGGGAFCPAAAARGKPGRERRGPPCTATSASHLPSGPRERRDDDKDEDEADAEAGKDRDPNVGPEPRAQGKAMSAAQVPMHPAQPGIRIATDRRLCARRAARLLDRTCSMGGVRRRGAGTGRSALLDHGPVR